MHMAIHIHNCMYVYNVHVVPVEEDIRCLGTESQMVVSHYVGAGNWAHVFWKSAPDCQAIPPALPYYHYFVYACIWCVWGGAHA